MRTRRALIAEVVIVLGLSLGQSAIYSIVSLIDASTRAPLRDQTTALNPSRNDREVFDFLYQFLGIVFDLMPVALVVYLLWSAARPHLGRLGIDFRHPVRDALIGVALAVVIGAGGIAVYLAGRATGVSVGVDPGGTDAHWWTVPILLLSAARAALSEELIVVGYLFERLKRIGLSRWTIIVGAAVLRGSYHLYQGYAGFVGNVVMGVIFGWLYTRFGRLLPLVVAHFVIDAVVFVGYPWAAGAFPQLFGLPG